MMDTPMPRRLLLMILVPVAILLVVVSETATSASSVQAVTADQSPPPIILPEPPPRYVFDAPPAPIPLQVERVDPGEILRQDGDSMILNHAGNSCAEAGLLEFPPGGTGTGDSSPVGHLSQNPDDPVLSCMWGNPVDLHGFRTAWYRFNVPRNGQVTITTFGSNYDTVLAVYQGSCEQLQKLACNDDHNMFSSKVTLSVRRDQTYYIEVADWEPSNPGGKTLELSVVLDPIDSEWQHLGNLTVPRTRHVGLTVGPHLYVIGGLSSFSGPDNFEASRRVDRYHTPSGQWSSLADVPAGGANRIGYFNSSGAFVNGRIHIPAGDDGGDDFAGQHWALNLDLGSPNPFPFWEERTPVNWNQWTDGLPVGFAATAVVGNGYFLTGGTTDAQNRLNSTGYTFFYNASTDVWIPRAEMNISRYAHTAAWVGGRLCVAGGIHVNEDPQAVLEPSAECYDPATDSWSLIQSPNIARYGAGSAVGANGKWYIFGGITAGNATVPEVEVYNPATGFWSVLGARFDLGGTDTSPARSWPRGGFIAYNIWAAGGNLVIDDTETGVLPLVERLYIAPHELYLPFMQGVPGDPAVINNTFALAQFLPFNHPIWQNFATQLDFFDVFYFDLPAQRVTTINLTNIPGDHDYDLLLYNNNKSLLAESRNLAGQNEQIVRNLAPGRYYVVVERVLPVSLPDPNAYYRLELK
jgi:hypothetical protein